MGAWGSGCINLVARAFTARGFEPSTALPERLRLNREGKTRVELNEAVGRILRRHWLLITVLVAAGIGVALSCMASGASAGSRVYRGE